MNDPNRLGHRQRLRDRFLTEANGARSDTALLELLLTYAIPQQDVQPLVQQLIARFGDLSNVLSASAHELCQINGIKLSTATLLKLVDWIRSRHTSEPGLASPAVSEPSYSVMTVMQPSLFTTEEPIGLGLENFDAIGRWREKEDNQPIDAKGELTDGSTFETPRQLVSILNKKQDQILLNLAQRMMTYSLGRGLQREDRCAIDRVMAYTETNNRTVRSLVEAIVLSGSFQQTPTLNPSPNLGASSDVQ